VGREVTERDGRRRESIHIPACRHDRGGGVMDDPGQVRRPVTAVVVMVLITVRVLTGIICRQVERRRIMPRYRLGMAVPREGHPRTEVNQQQQAEQ